MTAGITTLKLLSDPGLYERLEEKSDRLANGLLAAAKSAGVNASMNRVGSMFTLFFTGENVSDYTSALRSNQEMFARYFRGMLEEGIYLPPSQFEAVFVSLAHSDEDIDRTIAAAQKVFAHLGK